MPDSSPPGLHQRAKAVFSRCRDLPADEQLVVIEAECGDDAALRAEVESLLSALDPMGEAFLVDGTPGEALRSPAAPAPREVTGDRVGPYRLLSVLGQGGMGTVYEAEQDRPRRRVAVKVLAHGMLSPDAVARFEREAELLGRLTHPGIAQVHDAGADDALPGSSIRYFAMELVDGLPLTEHAEQHGLSRRERLELIALTCDAVAHAHERGVIHRDLKPANVLVDSTGQPKVLDFGVARPAALADTTATLQTRTGQLVGTLPYMSPEQASGRSADVDERTDVYALGVLAFELLAGRLPRKVEGLSLPQALHALQHGTADRLSAVSSDCRGDVDAIVGRALAHEPDQRYRTAAELAGDIRRYLRREPVVARRPSAAYRMRQFVRRHPAPVIGALATFVALSVGLALSARFAVREADQRRRADESARDARRGEYLASLAAAASALREHDVLAARQALSRGEPDLRGWEWQHLSSRLDDSVSRFRAVPVGRSITDGFVAGDGRTLTVQDGRDIVRMDALTGEGRETLWRRAADEQLAGLTSDGSHIILRDDQGVRLVVPARRRVLDIGSSSCRTFVTAERLLILDVEESVARLVDIESGEELSARPVQDLLGGSMTVDGRAALLLRSAETWRFSLWWPGTGRLLADLPCAAGPSQRLAKGALSPDGERAATGCGDGRLRLWSTADARELSSEEPSLGREFRTLCFSPDGSRLAAEVDAHVFLVDGHDGTLVARLGEARHEADIAFSPDSRTLAFTGRRNAVHVVRALDGARLATLNGLEEASRDLWFSADGRRLIAPTASGDVVLWRPLGDETRILSGHESFVYGVAVDPAGRRVASAGWDGAVRLWDLATGAEIAALRAPGPGVHGHVCFSSDGEHLLSAHDGVLSIRSLETGAILGHHGFERLDAGTGNTVPLVAVTDLSWQPGGRVFAVARATDKPSLGTWDPHAGLSLEPWPAPATTVAFSPDGSTLALGAGLRVEAWDVRSRERVLEFRGHDAPVRRVRFSPDGRWLASACGDGTARLWDTADGSELHVFRGHSGRVHSLAFTPDCSRLASGADDATIRIWDPQTGHELAVLEGHDDYVHALAFSPDGSTLVSGSGDGTVRIWATSPAGERLRALERRQALATALEPLVDGLLTDADGSVEVAARKLAQRSLGSHERRVAADLVLAAGAAADRPR